MIDIEGVEIRGTATGRQEEVLTREAVAFVASLQRRFNARRKVLLEARAERQRRIAAGEHVEVVSRASASRHEVQDPVDVELGRPCRAGADEGDHDGGRPCPSGRNRKTAPHGKGFRHWACSA